MKYTLLAMGLLVSVNGFAAGQSSGQSSGSNSVGSPDANWATPLQQRCKDFCAQNKQTVLACTKMHDQSYISPATPSTDPTAAAAANGDVTFSWSVTCKVPEN